MLRTALALALLATPALAQPKTAAPATPAAGLQQQVDQLKAENAQLKVVVQLLRQQRDTAQTQAADNSVEAYMAQHPQATAPPDPKK